jgi:hypothetical protein
MSPIALKIEDRFSRAAPGGSGGIKAVGNYAGSLLPQVPLPPPLVLSGHAASLTPY